MRNLLLHPLAAARAVVSQACTGRNQSADDDVLFQAAQVVLFAHNRGFGQNARGFLEGRGRDEAVGRQRGFGNTQQDIFKARRFFAVDQCFLINRHHFGAFYLFAGDEAGFARIDNVHAAQHLTDDDFDVFVGNLHALQSVNFLHLLNNIARQFFDAFQTQNVVRINRTVYDGFAAVYDLAVMHQNLFLFGNQGFVGYAVHVGNDEALFAFGFFTERHGTGYFGQHAGIFRDTGFKQFGHAR